MSGFKRKAAAPARSQEQLKEEISRLTAANLETPDRETERRLLAARHELGMRLVAEAPADPQHPDPSGVVLPEGDDLPEFSRDVLTPELIRAAILRDGCVLVRGLVPRDRALALAEGIDRAFAERAKVLARRWRRASPGYYEEFEPDPSLGFDPVLRGWVQEGGGVLAADAPKLAFEFIQLLADGGVPELVGGYLGEPPLVSFEKTTLRKAEPTVGGAWHQDGSFMGDVRALNLWLSLSRCGDESPGLDLVPRRLNELVTAGDTEVWLDYQVNDRTAAAAAAPKQIIRPIFEPGDALLFDELFLHQTGSDPAMPKPRFAVESWFFGGSAFPDYAPIAV